MGRAHLLADGLCYESCGLGGGWAASRWVAVVCEHVYTGEWEQLGDVFLRCVMCWCVVGCIPHCVFRVALHLWEVLGLRGRLSGGRHSRLTS